MISITEAKKAIESVISVMPETQILLGSSLGCVLSRDVFAQIDSPPFNKSAMDGFAIRHSDLKNQREFKISQTVKAGSIPQPLKVETVARIMTGAMLPEGADSVVPQENARESNGTVAFGGGPKIGQFVRVCGGEIKKGEQMFSRGDVLNIAALGFLASQGINDIFVFDKPRISIITSGDEIVDPRGVNRLETAQIFDSNLIGISACLSNIGIRTRELGIVKDEPEAIKSFIAEGLKTEILIISGGISVGKYDLVRTMLADLNVKEVFWGVNQKPGKPLYFGISATGNYIFAIPGNPAATIVCLYEYVLPAVKKMIGYRNIWPMKLMAGLEMPIEWGRDRVEFIRGLFDPNKRTVVPFAENESHMLRKFVLSNCLILAERDGSYKKDEEVEIHLI